MKNMFSIMSNLQTHYHVRLNFQKIDQHTGGKCLIHDTKHRKDNQLQAWNSPVEYLSRESKHDIKEFEGEVFNPIFKENVHGRNHPGRCAFAEPDLLAFRNALV